MQLAVLMSPKSNLCHLMARACSTAANHATHAGPLMDDQDRISNDLHVNHDRKMKLAESKAVSILPPNWQAMRFKYPEFLPSIEGCLKYRNTLREKLEREDMLKRRSVVEIPEFYVGSILRVEVSNEYASGKKSKFTGICIQREGQGLRAVFAIRNVIDGHGVEIRYDMYNPTIRNIEVLKLEKRLDPHLLYLRDALPEYSTIPEDMDAIPHEDGAEVPLNKVLVKMKPRPWGYKWERWDFRGIEKIEDVPEYMYKKYRDGTRGHHSKRKFDTMLNYRRHITEDEQYEIWSEVEKHEKDVVEIRRADRRKRLMQEQLRSRFRT